MASAHLEVWGDPIGHSRSPVLHLAAYRALGLDWSFTRREVSAARFSEHLARARVRGLAVTYPLKESAFAVAAQRDLRAELTGVANTLRFAGDEIRAYNTDVGGITSALREIGADGARRVRILGAGATATSALVAVSELSSESVEIAARSPERAKGLVDLGARAGTPTRAVALDQATDPVDLTIATLPGGTELDAIVAARLASTGGTLFDVAYSPWPTTLAASWAGDVHHGLPMLLHQAVLQVRIFTHGDPDTPLDGERAVIEAMRAALAGD